MMNTDYRIAAIGILLNRDCTLAKYDALIPHKESLIKNLTGMGCRTKSDCMSLADESLLKAGLPDLEMVKLFRQFLTQYDVKPAKLKEIASVCQNVEEAQAFGELYHLPGVKQIRATLYYRAGFRSLADIAASTPQEIISRTAAVIRKEQLDFIVPLMKEIKTHIAVAKAFTGDAAE